MFTRWPSKSRNSVWDGARRLRPRPVDLERDVVAPEAADDGDVVEPAARGDVVDHRVAAAGQRRAGRVDVGRVLRRAVDHAAGGVVHVEHGAAARDRAAQHVAGPQVHRVGVDVDAVEPEGHGVDALGPGPVAAAGVERVGLDAREARHRHEVVAVRRKHEVEEAVERLALVVVGRDRVPRRVVEEHERVELAVGRRVDVDHEPLAGRRTTHRVEVEVTRLVAGRAVRPVADRRVGGGRAAAPVQAGLVRQRDRPVVLRAWRRTARRRPAGRACPGSARPAGCRRPTRTPGSAARWRGCRCCRGSPPAPPRPPAVARARAPWGQRPASRPASPTIVSLRTASRRNRPWRGPAPGRRRGSRPPSHSRTRSAVLPARCLGTSCTPSRCAARAPSPGAASAVPAGTANASATAIEVVATIPPKRLIPPSPPEGSSTNPET